MNAGLRGGCVVSVCVFAFAACNWAQAPRESPIPTAPPGPMSPPPADFEGRFTLTFSADRSCAVLPQSLQTRTYTADISGHRVGVYMGALSGAEFFSRYDAFIVRPLNVGGRFSLNSLYAHDTWGDEETPIVERLTSGGYFALSGVADVPIRKSDSSVSAPFAGTFSYCARPTAPPFPDFPPSCTQPIDCTSSTHTLTVLRQ